MPDMKLESALIALALFFTLSGPSKAGAPDSEIQQLTIYTAKKIITMEPALPEATAVAVANGKIVAVGSLETLKPWTSKFDFTIDKTFDDKILMPGFIDPHIHPSLPAVLTQFSFLAPDDWSLPTGEFPGATTPEQYMDSLQALVKQHYADPSADTSVPFIAWGYHPLWHGDVYRDKLDQLFPDKPVMLWHRSFHELIVNSAAIKLLGVTQEETDGNHEIDWDKGHFWEIGAKLLLQKMTFVFAPERYGKGMENLVAMIHQGGITTVMDMGIGVFGNAEGEIELVNVAMNKPDVPSRIVLTPIVTDFIARGVSPQDALEEIRQWTENSNDKVMFDNHFKIMLDGAIFSGLAQYGFPGYIDGHEGVWLAPLDVTYEYARVFWDAGFQIHAHVNGDKSAAALIDMVSRLQAQKPRFDHRTVLEHFAYAKEDQLYHLGDLGVAVSANPYYQYMLADVYAEQWLGNDRARNMVPLGSVKRAGIRFALHSDAPMAPLSPLTLVWTAVNRTTVNGNQNFETQKVSVHDALKAVTIDAAWIMRWEDRIGSIRAGKNADFTVLEQDPYKVEPQKLKDISIWGTVFEGKKFPVQKTK